MFHLRRQSGPCSVLRRSLCVRIGLPKFLRINQRAKLDDVRNGIEVERIRFAAEPQRFERNRPAARKHIEHFRTRRASRHDVLHRNRLARLAGQPLRVRLENVLLRFLNDIRRAGIMAQPLNELGRVRPTERLLFLVARAIWHELRSRHERPIHRRPAGDKRSPCPP